MSASAAVPSVASVASSALVPSARRVAIVTGGARRVGAAIVRSFASRGYDVLLHHGNSPVEAAALAEELTSAHAVRVVPMQDDLRDAAAPARIIQQAMRTFGALDVVVSSASVMQRATFGEITPEQWELAEAVNLRAPFFLLQAASHVMREGGVFVQMADHLAQETGWSTLLPHQITKAALVQLVRAGAVEVAPRLRVNAVAPGLVLPPDDLSDAAIASFLRDVPLARAGSPDDVVQAIHFLVDAPYVTGVVLPVDGGRTLRR